MGRVYIVWKLTPELGKLVRVVDGPGGAAVTEVWFVDFTYHCGADWNTWLYGGVPTVHWNQTAVYYM